MTYKHIILTRFNLQYDLQSDIHIESNWLNERFRLFEQYCLPSILQQTNQNFVWIILACQQTPQEYQRRFDKLIGENTHIKIEYCAYYDDVNRLYQTIGEKYIENYDFLLSTRIDNDDMLAKHFVETLQTYVNSHINTNSIITFPRGIQWFEKANIAFSASYIQNHFLNMFESRENIHTCLGFNHTSIKKEEVVKLDNQSMWCEIVHESNMCNSYTPKYHYSLNILPNLYPIQVEVNDKRKQWRFLIIEHLKFRYNQIKHHLLKLIGRRIS